MKISLPDHRGTMVDYTLTGTPVKGVRLGR
jgi:hypothetical protein